jgi:hypothetical protein
MILTTKNSGLTYKVIAILGLYLGVTGLSYSQPTNGLANSFDGNTVESPIVQNSKIPLKKALQIISEKAGLILSYRTGLFLSSKEVSLDPTKVDVEEALEKIFANTKFKYKITKTRHLVVYKERKFGHVKGDVFDSVSGSPLQGAKVFLVKSKDISGLGIKNYEAPKSTFVASTGSYDINNVEAGTYRLIIIDKGCKKVYKKVQVEGKETTIQNFRLTYPRN